MPDPITGLIVGGSVVTSVISARAQSKAAEGASEAQFEASRLGIEESRRQFDKTQELLKPYTDVGRQSIERQSVLAGLRGPEAKAKLMKEIEESPAFETMTAQGESAILQSASATGGLRGGNVQGALAQFRPELLDQFLSREYDRLGGLTGVGQASAAGVASAGQRTGETVTNLITQGGQATAGNILAQGEIQSRLWGDIGENVGIIAGSF